MKQNLSKRLLTIALCTFSLTAAIAIDTVQEPLRRVNYFGFNDARINHEENRAFISSGTGTVYTQDLTTGEILDSLVGPDSNAVSIAVTKDMKILASATDSIVQVFNMETGELMKELVPDMGDIDKINFNHTGTYLVISGDTLQGWSMEDYRRKWGNFPGTNQIIPMKTGQYLAYNNYTINKRNGSGQKEATVYSSDASLTSFALSDDETLVAAKHADSTIRVIDMASGEVQCSIKTADKYCNGLGLTGDNSKLFVSNNKEMLVYNASTGEELRKISVPLWSARIKAVQGNDVLLNSWGTFYRYSWDGDSLATLPNDFINRITKLKLSGDNKTVAAITGNYEAALYDMKTGKRSATLKDGTTFNYQNDISFSPDGSEAVTASGSGDYHQIIRWDMNTGTEISRAQYHCKITALEYSPAGTEIGVATDDNTYLTDIQLTDTTRISFAGGKHITFSKDGSYIAFTGGPHDYVNLYDVAAGEGKTLQTTVDPIIRTIAFNANSTQIAAGFNYDSYGTSGKSGGILIWDCETQNQIKRFYANDTVTAISYSPNGKYLAAGMPNNRAIVYRTDSFDTLAVINTTARFVAFSNDNTLYTGSDNGAIQEWVLRDYEVSTAPVQVTASHAASVIVQGDNISVQGVAGTALSLELFTVNGKKIAHAAGNSAVPTLSMKGLSNGVYIAVVKEGVSTKVVQKISRGL